MSNNLNDLEMAKMKRNMTIFKSWRGRSFKYLKTKMILMKWQLPIAWRAPD